MWQHTTWEPENVCTETCGLGTQHECDCRCGKHDLYANYDSDSSGLPSSAEDHIIGIPHVNVAVRAFVAGNLCEPVMFFGAYVGSKVSDLRDSIAARLLDDPSLESSFITHGFTIWYRDSTHADEEIIPETQNLRITIFPRPLE